MYHVAYSKSIGLFWSNQDGWGDFNSATRFHHEETDLNLPMPDAEWLKIAE